MAFTNRIKFELQVLRYIIPTIYFNFHYLPLKQAVKLPIVFYKPHFGILKGQVIIQPMGGGKIKHAMINLGFDKVALYPSDGIRFQNAGGIVLFKGACSVGNSSAIAVGKRGKLEIGANFSSSAALRIACQHYIKYGEGVRCGWETLFMDTDFHKMTGLNDIVPPKPFAPIYIGNKCWFGTKVIVLKGTRLPDCCTVATNSMCNKTYCDSYTIYAGIPAKPVKHGLYRDVENDIIIYPEVLEQLI